MHSLQLQCRRLNIYRNASCLLKKYVKSSIRTCYSNYSTAAVDINDVEQFRAAVLHPKKQNLCVETLVLPETAASGMVIIKSIDFR